MKTNDGDWVEDVRRWYFSAGRPAAAPAADAVPPAAVVDAAELGYEAAHPSLETQTWSRPAATAFGRLG